MPRSGLVQQCDPPNGYPRHAGCLGSFLTRQESSHRQPSVIGDVSKKNTTMNTALHSVDPIFQKISRSLESFTRTVIDIYIGIFVAVGSGFLILFGAMFVLLGITLPMQDYSALSASAIILPLGLAWIFSANMRKITWIFMGFMVIWMIMLTATLMPFIDVEARQPLPFQIAFAFAYLIPPLLATTIAMKYKTKC